MGVAMAGMLEPRLSPVPGLVWRAVFTAGAAWFAWQAIRGRRRSRPAGSWCAHPVPHAVECAAMVYMLLPAGAVRAGHGPGRGMPGMSGPAGATAGNPALALVLALFMLSYMLWTTDRLTALSRARSTPGPAGAAQPGTAAGAALAPRFAACYKIAMSIAMCYMLILMI
jgi:Domain of unknown function (DUF5134)